MLSNIRQQTVKLRDLSLSIYVTYILNLYKLVT